MGLSILITGSSGLVGSALRRDLSALGVRTVPFDIAPSGDPNGHGVGDIRNIDDIRQAVQSCDGIIHLAAISRVISGERDPKACWATNVNGVQNLLEVLTEQSKTASLRPWLIFASSREVYGQPNHFPANEDTPLCPVNIYGRSKVAGEQMVEAVAREGFRAAIIRLSNVYGSVDDHVDRVIPAFVRAAITDAPLKVEGADQTFDFTHIDDVSRGIIKLVFMLADKASISFPIHFVTGNPVTLGQLATTIIDLAQSSSLTCHAKPRNFDVAHFYGSPQRAKSVLGWTPEISLEQGLGRLIQDMRETIVNGGKCFTKARMATKDATG